MGERLSLDRLCDGVQACSKTLFRYIWTMQCQCRNFLGIMNSECRLKYHVDKECTLPAMPCGHAILCTMYALLIPKAWQWSCQHKCGCRRYHAMLCQGLQDFQFEESSKMLPGWKAEIDSRTMHQLGRACPRWVWTQHHCCLRCSARGCREVQTGNYSLNPNPMAVGMASRLGDTNDMAQQTGRLGAAKGLLLRPQCLPVKEACVAVLGLFDQLARPRGSIIAPFCGYTFRILDKGIPKRNYIRAYG